MGSRQSGDRSEAGETKEYVRDEVSKDYLGQASSESQPTCHFNFLPFSFFFVVFGGGRSSGFFVMFRFSRQGSVCPRCP